MKSIGFPWNSEDLKALNDCIEEKWKPLAEGDTNCFEEPSCALCVLDYKRDNGSGCWNCIIYKDTLKHTCAGTVYQQWEDACGEGLLLVSLEYAAKMLAYLEDLKHRMEASRESL